MSGRTSGSNREGARIEDVVGDHVQSRRAGADAEGAGCPFHNEKSPAAHHGHFHASAAAGGDVYAFIQKIGARASGRRLELLPTGSGHTISHTGAATSVQRDRGSRSRLLAANAPRQRSMRRR